jgi:hypothetical protein
VEKAKIGLLEGGVTITLVPFEEQHKVSGAVGPVYTVPHECAHPDCDVRDIQRHHLCRRSFLAGAYDWIEYEGVMIQNIVGLCLEHHQQVTENKAWITWSNLGFFSWVSLDEHDHLYGIERKLVPHPQVGLTPDMSGGYVPEENPEVCPTCLRPHRKKTKTEQARLRKQWTISVPVDEREKGADVLDTLLEETRKLMAAAGLPYGDEDNARYFVLTGALSLLVLHGERVLGDG